MKHFFTSLFSSVVIIATSFAFVPTAQANSSSEMILPPSLNPTDVRVSSIGQTGAHIALVAPTTWIVSLGARVNPDCSNPGVLEERLNKTAQIAHQFPVNPILVSGGYTQPGCQSEATSMFNGLVARGVAPWRIVKDETAGSTIGNAQAAAKIAAPYGGVLITSSDHMYRALNTFDSYAPHKLWLGISA